MSLSRGCIVAELEPGEWYCAVADREYDYDFNDGTVYGPADDKLKALELMHECESNPGAFNTISHERVTDSVRHLFKRLRKGQKRSAFMFGYI